MRVAAVFPIHYPRELFRVFSIHPVEVWGPPGRDTVEGDAHLQQYTCSVVRSALSFLLSARLAQVDLFVFPHACDSLQGLASLYQDYVPHTGEIVTLYLPRGRRNIDVEFLTRELRCVYDQLARFMETAPSEEMLHEAIDREQEADLKFAELFRVRTALAMSNRRFYELIRSREYLPPDQFVQLTKDAQATRSDSQNSVKRVVLSGLLPEPMRVFDILDDAGLIVAEDDLACTGRRRYPPSTHRDPFHRMAERLQKSPPDATLGCSVQDRINRLLELTRLSQSQGVIHLDVKFCEPEMFYLPIVNRALADAGISTLQVEIDIADDLPDSIVTSIEAFSETLS
jgi:benzoyl-CoA reductase/2-hydroxyglutaryl-CoA dehydratase subunit BcrC/BadD/HgdB